MAQFTTQSIESDIGYGLGLLSSFGQNVDVVGIYANGPGNVAGQTGSTGLASSIVNSLIGFTGINAAFGQMFANARPLKAVIRETSKIMEHPLEIGTTIADHHIINPVEIDLQMIVTSTQPGLLGSLLGATTAQNYAVTYSQIRQAFINATPLSVKTRVGTYSNMIIADMPHEEDAEMYDSIVIALHLKQVLYSSSGQGSAAQSFQPLSPANSNTTGSGLQQAVALGTQILSAAGSISSYAAVARKGFL